LPTGIWDSRPAALLRLVDLALACPAQRHHQFAGFARHRFQKVCQRGNAHHAAAQTDIGGH
jgi:hypothetical protein